jgi:hypothetical protein
LSSCQQLATSFLNSKPLCLCVSVVIRFFSAVPPHKAR